jgi:hypothetical protein
MRKSTLHPASIRRAPVLSIPPAPTLHLAMRESIPRMCYPRADSFLLLPGKWTGSTVRRLSAQTQNIEGTSAQSLRLSVFR